MVPDIQRININGPIKCKLNRNTHYSAGDFPFPIKALLYYFPVLSTFCLIDRVETPSLISRQNDDGRRRQGPNFSLSQFSHQIRFIPVSTARSLEKWPIKLNIFLIWIVTSNTYGYDRIQLNATILHLRLLLQWFLIYLIQENRHNKTDSCLMKTGKKNFLWLLWNKLNWFQFVI